MMTINPFVICIETETGNGRVRRGLEKQMGLEMINI